MLLDALRRMWCQTFHEPHYSRYGDGPWFARCDECRLVWRTKHYVRIGGS